MIVVSGPVSQKSSINETLNWTLNDKPNAQVRLRVASTCNCGVKIILKHRLVLCDTGSKYNPGALMMSISK